MKKTPPKSGRTAFHPVRFPGPVPQIPAKRLLLPTVPSWWIPGQALEEYEAGFQRDEAHRLEAISTAAANGKLKTPGQVKRLAARLGCTARHILKYQTNKIMVDRVTELIRMKAVYGAAEALPSQIERAHEDPVAFKTVLQVGRILEQGAGSKTQVNVAIDRRNGGDNESAAKFVERFRERGLMRVGNNVNKAKAEDVEVNGDSSG